LLPICSYCKKIRDDQNYWQQVEAYISSHTDAQFSHGVCPDCYERILRPEMEAFRNKILSRKT
jgi:sigma-B regulation protein RsbU (phosphoserine phosphatase)